MFERFVSPAASASMAASVSLVDQLSGKSIVGPSFTSKEKAAQRLAPFSVCSAINPNNRQTAFSRQKAGCMKRLDRLRAPLAPPARKCAESEKGRASRSWRCQSQELDNAEGTVDTPDISEPVFEEESSPCTSGSSGTEFPAPTKTLNQRLALASVAVAVGMFVATRGAGAGPDLNQLAAGAMQYDAAIANGRPTVVEFYADWCVVCREMAKEVYLAEQNYKDKVNFVLLNIDNKRWAEEVEEYGVGGIPHFVFLDSDGVEEGSAVGKLPRSILEENLAAMARGGKLLPHSGVVGRVTEPGQRPAGLTAPAVVGPRTHG